MSLINEALKKAQRSRGADLADLAPPLPGGDGKVATRRPRPAASTTLLYATGGLVLFVVAVVGAVYFLNRPAKSTPVAVQKAVIPPPGASGTSSPVIVLPVITPPPPPPTPAPAAAENSASAAVAPAPNATGAKQPAAPATAAAPAPAPVTPAPAAPSPPAQADERIYLYLDALHITAVRLQGNDSRVIINERVFRLNEIIDRPLSLRLTKVEADHLIFTDINGVTYVKYF